MRLKYMHILGSLQVHTLYLPCNISEELVPRLSILILLPDHLKKSKAAHLSQVFCGGGHICLTATQTGIVFQVLLGHALVDTMRNAGWQLLLLLVLLLVLLLWLLL